MNYLIAFCLLAFLGGVDSFYLFYKSRRGQPVACPLRGECQAVLASRWNKFWGIKNEVWGLSYYSFLFFLGCLLLIIPQGTKLLWPWLMFFVSGGFLYSVFLTYIQLIRIKETCVFCYLLMFCCWTDKKRQVLGLASKIGKMYPL